MVTHGLATNTPRDLDGSDIFWAVGLGVVTGAIWLFVVMPLPSETAREHCNARGLEYSQIATSGEIECVKVTREVVK